MQGCYEQSSFSNAVFAYEALEKLLHTARPKDMNYLGNFKIFKDLIGIVLCEALALRYTNEELRGGNNA